MPTKKTQPVNMFADAASQRQKEQEKIESDVIGTQQPEKLRKRGAHATTITLAISREDKTQLKILAANRGLTASDLLHIWIQQADPDEGWWNTI